MLNITCLYLFLFFQGTSHDNDDIDDFIDLDDPFYHDNVLPTSNIKIPETKIKLKSSVTSRPEVNIQVEDGFDIGDTDVVDDDDVNEVSGAGSGSGSDGDASSNILNITTLTAKRK